MTSSDRHKSKELQEAVIKGAHDEFRVYIRGIHPLLPDRNSILACVVGLQLEETDDVVYIGASVCHPNDLPQTRNLVVQRARGRAALGFLYEDKKVAYRNSDTFCAVITNDALYQFAKYVNSDNQEKDPRVVLFELFKKNPPRFVEKFPYMKYESLFNKKEEPVSAT